MYRRTIASVLAMALALVLGAAGPAYAQTVVATIPVGAGPSSVAVNPRTNRIYVANRDSDTVSVIDGATNTVVSTIPVEGGPTGVAVNAKTNRVYVTNGNDYVSVIDGATNAVVTTLAVGDVAGVAVNE